MNSFTRPNNISGGFNSFGLDEETKREFDAMFDENGELIVRDIYGNIVREDGVSVVQAEEEKDQAEIEVEVKEEAPAPETKEEKPTQKKEDWEVNMPTSNETMKLKKTQFSYEVYSAVVLMSKWNSDLKEQHRYIYKDDFSKKECWETLNNKCMTYDTFLKLFKELIERGFIIEDNYNGSDVYKIPNKFDAGHLLFDNRFLNKTNRLFNRNVIKIYIQYYKYCYKNENSGVYKMPQTKTLQAIGMCGNEKNKEFLREVNRLLAKLGLIEIQEVGHIKGKVLEIRCPHYKETSFYKEIIG